MDFTPLCNEGGDQVVTVTAIGPNEGLDVNVIGGGVAGGVAMMQVRNVANAWTDVGWFAGNEEVPVLIYDGVNQVPVFANWMPATQDERVPSIPVTAGNYGYYAAGLVGAQAYPFLNDLDDNVIDPLQIPQIVIPLLYGYDENSAAWQRLHTDGANSLHVFITGGIAPITINSEYVDDTLFTVAVDYTMSIGGIVTNDLVNLNDIGALRMSEYRNLYTKLTDDIDVLDIVTENDPKVNGILAFGYNTPLNTVHAHRVVAPGDPIDFGFLMYGANPGIGTSLPIPLVTDADFYPPEYGIISYGVHRIGATIHPLPVEVDTAPHGGFSLPIGGHDYTPNIFNTNRVDVNGFQYTAIVDTGTLIYNEIFGSMFMLTQDEMTNALVVASGGYSYYGGNPANTRAVPIISDLDDNTIAAGQIPQIVIPLLYGYDFEGGVWQRLYTDGGGSLNVNITGGAFGINSEYVDDTAFTVAVDHTVSIGGVVTDDLVNANDIGALRMSTYRNLYTKLTDDIDVLDIVTEGDEKINGILGFGFNTNLNTVHANRLVVDADPYLPEFGIISYGLHRMGIPVPTVHPIPIEMDAAEWGGYSLPVGGHDYGVVPNVFFTHRVDQNGFQYAAIVDSASGIFNEIFTDMFVPFQDETTNAVVTAAGNYAYFDQYPPNSQAVPLLADFDDDDIYAEQIPQLVIPLLYAFEDVTWRRVTSVGGALNVNVVAGGAGLGSWANVERLPTTVAAVSLNVTFTQIVYAIFVKNQHPANTVWLKIDGGAATANNACVEITPGDTYYDTYTVPVLVGISFIANGAGTTIYVAGYF